MVMKTLEVKNRKKQRNGTMMKMENGSTSKKKIKQRPGHINTLIEKKNIKKKHEDGLERRYKMK